MDQYIIFFDEKAWFLIKSLTESAQLNFSNCMAVYTIRTVAIIVVEG